MKQRTAGRVFLLNSQDQILLIRFAFPQSHGTLHFWATPGGGVEAGESTLAAAQRELREELGICPTLVGPVHCGSGVFEYEGVLVSNQDVFYTARWTGSTPTLTGVTPLEQAAMKQIRWWSHADLLATRETVYPAGLADLLQRLATQLQPAD